MNPIKKLEEKGWVIGLAFLLLLAATDTRANGCDALYQTGHSTFLGSEPIGGLATF